MQIPVEVLYSTIRGGVFIQTGRYSGEWRISGKLIAEWSRGKDKKAVVTWHIAK